MSYLRLLLILLGAVIVPSILTFTTLLQAHPRGNAAADTDLEEASESSFRTFFSFHTPSTLFPPSAIISLTDDNSTFFLARPADFGPTLASDGLSGPLWIGSGFGDGVEGELGCSDIPGWDEASQQFRRELQLLESVHDRDSKASKDGKQKRTDSTANPDNVYQGATGIMASDEDDGTDDHLHHPLPSSVVAKASKPGEPAEHELLRDGQPATHADIQSLQESAEIAGKVVLLSRGGCGFLEKVKWAQRRGAISLIVGDHTRGGALVTMYARGDTSNVSIPSVFTSHTTAHLLASLIPAESQNTDTGSLAKSSTLTPINQASERKNKAAMSINNDGPTFTQSGISRATAISSIRSRGLQNPANGARSDPAADKPTWLRSLFGRSSKSPPTTKDNTRPPSSGRLDWFSSKKSDDSHQKDTGGQTPPQNDKSNTKTSGKDGWWPGPHSSSNDDFVIGVQDWRDPDVVVAKSSMSRSVSTSAARTASAAASQSSKSSKADSTEKSSGNKLSGGSITPGSGQYQRPDQNSEMQNDAVETLAKADGQKVRNHSNEGSSSVNKATAHRKHQNIAEEHDGLWVTITPTTMSSSPFFDTLLVLVVSPLVTLTVVYALLLLRSRIRRRRWRAPKSVVERLPIRTYHTMSCSSTASSTRFTSRNASPTSPQSQTSLYSLTRNRPRSATASGIGEAATAALNEASNTTPLLEKARKGPGRKRYNGKQSECVVCLEEYVDGKSRVMSLPCGHEFHAECITPWLTTRRRTCPICKGDVVRSLAHAPSSPSSTAAASSQAQAATSDSVQTQAAETVNDSPTAAIPIPCNEDLERGDDDMAATLVDDQAGSSSSGQRAGWRGLANMSLSAFSGEAVWREAREDRNR